MIKKLYLFNIQHIIDIFDVTSYKILYLISSYNFSQLRSNVLFVTNFLIWNDLQNYHITNPLFFSYQNVRLLFFFVPSLSPELTDEGQNLSPEEKNLSLDIILRGDFLRMKNLYNWLDDYNLKGQKIFYNYWVWAEICGSPNGNNRHLSLRFRCR